jgi:hypothetical protein
MDQIHLSPLVDQIQLALGHISNSSCCNTSCILQLGGGGAAFLGALGAFPIPTAAGPTISASSCSATCSAVRGLRPPLAPPPPALPAQPPCSASLGLRWWRPLRRTPARPAPSPSSLNSGEPRQGGRRRRAVSGLPRSGVRARGGRRSVGANLDSGGPR